jgi:hypothetical protein
LGAWGQWEKTLIYSTDEEQSVKAKITRQLLEFIFTHGVNVVAVSGRDQVVDKGEIIAPDEVAFTFPNSGNLYPAGVSLSYFVDFAPYWNFLDDAANSGSVAKLTDALVRTEGTITAAKVSLSDKSKIFVLDDSSTQLTIDGSKISSGKIRVDGKFLFISWNEQGKAEPNHGTVITLSGGGFKISADEELFRK